MIDISSFTHRKTHFAQTGQKQNKTHQNSLGVFPQINPPFSLWKYPPLDVFFHPLRMSNYLSVLCGFVPLL